jgi:uncharacterized protein YbjT (DUF2867 family)
MSVGQRILLTGATGYVGGRLLPLLEARGHKVRCLARRPEHLRTRIGPDTEVVRGDVLDRASLDVALSGVDVAYYLVHSMESSEDFGDTDRKAAALFSQACRLAGVRRIIYLGGLGEGPDLSDHLRSRQEVGRILGESGVPTIEFRASVVIGSGSFSFEMLRALVEKLPVMITPSWVRTHAQPISIEDLLAYLLGALDLPLDGGRVFEIGGSSVVSYGEIMQEYGRRRGLRRVMIPVPVLTPYLSSLWLGLVTPVYARVGRHLVDGLRNTTVVRDHSALREFDLKPRGIGEAIDRALANEDREFAQTRWSDALSATSPQRSWAGVRFGSRIVDSRSLCVPCSPAAAFRPIRRIGGTVGWYYADWLWRLRGFLDLLVGGAGIRRGRRDPETPSAGDTVDFWRVESYEPDRLLALNAEMKLPGRAWLQFEVEPLADGGSRIRQTAIFDPVGLFGLLYWYGLYPLHVVVFRGMLRGIAQAALAASADTEVGTQTIASDSRSGFSMTKETKLST